MKRHTVIYKPFDIVVVPFPFVDSSATKKRPALVLSSFDQFGRHIHHSVMAMITSSQHNSWPLDVSIENLAVAGLKAPSIIRMKLFTIDHRFILKKCGCLGTKDQDACAASLEKLFKGGEGVLRWRGVRKSRGD
jgi:mRNA interferase MazF